MWNNLGRFLRACWKDENGALTTLEYLILTLLLGGIAGAIVVGLRGSLTGTHNSMMNTITGITGSGF